MKHSIFPKKLLLIFGILTCYSLANIQGQKLSLSSNVGLAKMHGEDKLGYYFGLNPHKIINSGIGLEGQFSFVYFNNNGKWNYAVTTLVGGRLYLNPKEEGLKMYLNLLLGGSYNRSSSFDFINSGMKVGYSAGLFFDTNRFNVGISYDAPKSLILKLGYTIYSRSTIY